MARSNLDTLLVGHAIFNSGDFDRMSEVVSEDVEWGTTGTFPGISPVYHGLDGMAKWTDALLSAFELFQVELVRVIDESDRMLLIEERIRGRGRGSGVEVQMEIFPIYVLEDHKLRRRLSFDTEDEACEAAGRLAESLDAV